MTLSLSTYCVHAALHHCRFRVQARDAAGDVASQDVNIRPVCLLVPLVRVCGAACVEAYLKQDDINKYML